MYSLSRIGERKYVLSQAIMDEQKQNQNAGYKERVLEETRAVISGYTREKSNLIPLLQKVQEKIGYLPGEAMKEIAGYLNIAGIAVYEVATFYNQFRLNPPGKHSIKVCLGTACHMKGGNITLEAWKRRLKIDTSQTTPDRDFDLNTVACVGCCHMAPVTVVDNIPQGQVETTKVDGILLGFGYEYETKDKEKK
jgi:NADH-quinone oxidoreductase subunit E